MSYVVTFHEIDCQRVRLVGGKAAGLARMTGAGLPVAAGFAVTAPAYLRFIDQRDLRSLIGHQLRSINLKDPDEVEQAAAALHARLSDMQLPVDVQADVSQAYARLCAQLGIVDVAVAVRSSATAEDSVDASFAGEFETYVDIVGTDSVLEHVRQCYLSVFVARVLSYLGHHGIDPMAVEMAVVIQKTVRARSAGVMFTLDPVTGDRAKILIEASWGLGLAVVGGEVTPDRFSLNKIGLDITARIIGDKSVEYRRGDQLVEVPVDRRRRLCMSDAELVTLAKFGKKLEQLHRSPQDIEFAIDQELDEGANIILLQCRPETVWSPARRVPVFERTASVVSWVTSSIAEPIPAAKPGSPQSAKEKP